MRFNYREQGVTAQNTLDYVNNMLAVEDFDNEKQRQMNIENALATCYSYLVQKKVEWTIKLQKLAELFLELAFETEKYSNIKEVLKQYRSITQSQHPDSLRHVLEYYRDKKLQVILEEEIPADDIDFIRSMRNIEDDEASSEIILSSFNPEVKNKREAIRQKLKIVWDGFKAIIDTVRFNQKLETVYRDTLKQIFEFVDHYNRKEEFKSFCEYLRLGLRISMNRRDRTEQQRGFYIDIENEEVNKNNIEIRLEQFNVTTKLGLWDQAFKILQDINELMRVRKGSVKNSLKCFYLQKLAFLFQKSNYWHYHAYALYSYYSIYITKSKITAEEKTSLANKLLLSVLCIPPITLESHQSRESQEKIGAMMVISSQIPSKENLQEMMITKGIVENASKQIKQLWYFMFLEFDLASLSKGLKLINNISEKEEYKEYFGLLEDILIYKQLISIAEVYQRIKYKSLLDQIPLQKAKIQKILLECHHRKVLEFVFDEKQGLIIFQDKTEETNPYEQFLSAYTDIALIRQEVRDYDRPFIMKKVIEFSENAEEYYWKIRQFKIDEYKKKLKKPKQDLMNKEREREKKKREEKEREQNERKVKQIEAKAEEQKKREMLVKKKVAIDEIMKVKQSRVVRIGKKKIQNLTNEQINEISLEVFQKYLQETRSRVINDNQARNHKKFAKVDYFQRERRQILKPQILKSISENQSQILEKTKEVSRAQYEQSQVLKASISKIAEEVKKKINKHYQQNLNKYNEDLKKYHLDLDELMKKKILDTARALKKQAEKQKKQKQEKLKQAEKQAPSETWSFKSPSASNANTAEKGSQDKWIKKTVTSEPTQKRQTEEKKNEGSWGRKKIQSTNIYEQLVDNEVEDKNAAWGRKKIDVNIEEAADKKGKQEKWIGAKKQQSEVKEVKQQQKFQPPAIEKPTGAWGKKTTTAKEPTEPTLTFKPPPKKQTKTEVTKGKGW